MNQNELEHYGVKGMKWGVRNAPSKDEILTARKRVSDATKAAKQNATSASDRRYRMDQVKASSDWKTSRTYTRGEKFAIGFGAAALTPGFGLGAAGIPVALAAGAATPALFTASFRKTADRQSARAAERVKKADSSRN